MVGFLSTLSLRRATTEEDMIFEEQTISIHALLAESDVSLMLYDTSSLIFLSTLSLRRATRGGDLCYLDNIISIHALLAESDGDNHTVSMPVGHFYPRSPCGERLMGTAPSATLLIFLSTLSLRRATIKKTITFYPPVISIHALLAESDVNGVCLIVHIGGFLSTLSLRRATYQQDERRANQSISIHALLAESDTTYFEISSIDDLISIHALLAESDASSIYLQTRAVLFLSTLSLRRAT